MHKLLKRHLEKYNLDENVLPDSLEAWKGLLEGVSGDFQMLEEDGVGEQLLQTHASIINSLQNKNLFLKYLARGHSFEAMANFMGEKLIGQFNASAFALFLLDKEKNELEMKVSKLLPDEIKKILSRLPVTFGNNVASNVFFSGTESVERNLSRYSIWSEENIPPSLACYKSIWCFPIADESGTPYGVFALYFYAPIRTPSVLELEMLQNLIQLFQLSHESDSKKQRSDEEQIKIITSGRQAVLGEMAGGIAHEINNPLTIINLNSHKMKQLLSKGTLTVESGLKIMDDISKTVERISKIIHALRVLSRDDSKIEKSVTCINEIMETAMSLCSEKIKNAGIQLRYKPMSEDVFVFCNMVQIAQIAVNLISNAFDAVEKMEDPWIEISLKKLKGKILLKITDSGSGISEAVTAKMMQPFFTTKEVGKGTGLGLSISQNIIKKNEGELYYDNASKNTCFVVALPIHRLEKKIA